MQYRGAAAGLVSVYTCKDHSTELSTNQFSRLSARSVVCMIDLFEDLNKVCLMMGSIRIARVVVVALLYEVITNLRPHF